VKLINIEPVTIGQAQRIPGMTQAALTAILIFMKKREWETAAPEKKNIVKTQD
jgi:tRNA U34 5-carboxymethylaminomethyl modifying enzyme MnmG/GidA